GCCNCVRSHTACRCHGWRRRRERRRKWTAAAHRFPGGRPSGHCFSYLLGYSRRQYLRFVETQGPTTTLREHIRDFAYLGGVAATCL
ncbi:MAG: hypothetical protein L0Z62_37225, partial [Gemmataceae bacterium]|nr:hypothetical protein [Gemmataceae bacterium]